MTGLPDANFDELDGFRHGNCAFSPDTLGLRVASRRDDAPFHLPELHKSVGTFPIEGRLAHESDHLLRTIGTSWGLMIHLLQGRALQYYLVILSEIDLRTRLGSERLVDFAGRCRRLGSAMPEVARGDFLACRLHALSRELEVRRVLMGFLPYGPQGEIEETIRKFWGVHRLASRIQDLWPHVEGEFQPPLPTGSRSYPINAASIVESLGILKEYIYAIEHKEAAHGEVLQRAEHPYVLALSFAKAVLKDRFDWEYQPVELEGALNLALWPPFVPSSLSALRPWNWEDLEPGHRFYRIIGWLSHQTGSLTKHDTLTREGRNAFFTQFFHEAAQHFQWPTPDELAQSWIDHLQRATPWGRTKYAWWCLGEKRVRTTYALHLLRAFRLEPYYAWFTSPEELGCQRPTFSHVTYDDLIEIPEHHCDEKGTTISARLESYVFLGMRLVLGYRHSLREADNEIVDHHIRVLPNFIEPGPQQDTVRKNCVFLRDELLE